MPDLTAGGMLPLGRHHVTLDEVERRFVDDYPGSTRRSLVWDDFQRSLGALRSLLPPCAVWIGGSFVTSKPDPGDIDVTWILPRDAANALHADPRTRARLALFAGEQRLIAKGVLVDSYVMSWAPWADPTLADLGYKEMAARRGYWDDWWQRQRPVGAVSHASGSVPRRGYLEVTLDGYPV